jgi:Ala-tRNA(Pro) deacylase
VLHSTSEREEIQLSETEFQRIKELFDSLNLPYQAMAHEAVRTSEDAARVRNCPIEDGVKAMVLECKRSGKTFLVCADLAAHKKIDLKKLQEILKADEMKFLPLERVEKETGCPPGGVPPLGHSPKIPVLVDESVFERQQSEFNAGLTTKSIRLKTIDLKRAFEAYGAAFFKFSK